MNAQIAIMRSAQSGLHRTSLPITEANRIGEQIASSLVKPGNFEQATARYNTTDVCEIGERAAKEYVKLMMA